MQLKNVLFYGDSKTVDGIILPTLALLANRYGYLPRLEARLGLGGRTVATAASTIDADIAAVTGSVDLILFNLGVNDVGSLPAQGTWTTNCAYILDAMHTKWSSAKVYIMRVWRRDYESQCATLNDTYVPVVLSTRSSWASVGPDEGVFLKAGDNGQSLTTDGVHPNAAGNIATGQAWGGHVQL